MRFLHTSDWHLGAAESEHSLLEDQKDFLEKVCGIIQDKQVDALLLAGDVYDRSIASAEAIRLFNDAMSALCVKLGIPVLIIAGNHDSAERLAACSELLEKANLYVAGAASREPRVVSFADADVYLLPWITEEKVKSLYPEERDSIQSLDDAYRTMTRHMRETFVPGKKHLIMSHAFITNAETSTSDRAAEIGFATQVSASVFEGFDYVALGHIHKPQDVNSFIRYSGTPIAYSFGKEETQVKSVTILDTDTMEKEVVPIPALHPRQTLVGTFDQLAAPSFAPDAHEKYVRLQVTDCAVGLEMQRQLMDVYQYPLIISGKLYQDGSSSVTMTLEELKQMERDPLAVFRSYCQESLKIDVSDHLQKLFEDAVAAAEEEEV